MPMQDTVLYLSAEAYAMLSRDRSLRFQMGLLGWCLIRLE